MTAFKLGLTIKGRHRSTVNRQPVRIDQMAPCLNGMAKITDMQKGSIRVQTENIFPIIKKFLYSDHEIFLRELISNAVDASQKLRTLASIGEAKGEIGDLAIQVKLDKEKKTITIS